MTYARFAHLQSPHLWQWRARAAEIIARSSSNAGRIEATCSGVDGLRTNLRMGPTNLWLHQDGECCRRSVVNNPLKNISEIVRSGTTLVAGVRSVSVRWIVCKCTELCQSVHHVNRKNVAAQR